MAMCLTACATDPPMCPAMCPAATPMCVEGRCVECAGDLECGDQVCSDGSCVPCGDDLPCSDGRACDGGACTGCAIDAHCEEAQVCRDGVCRAVCRIESDCAADVWLAGENPPSFFGCRYHSTGTLFSVCDGSGPLVRGPVGLFCDPCLASFGGCGAGHECVDGDCTCETNADCPDSLVCRDGVCGTCTASADCRCEQVCEAGSCVAACTSDADCPGARCDLESGRCPRCLSDADCGTPGRCYADGCVISCEIAGDCIVPAACRASGRCTGCEHPLGPPSFAPVARCL